MAIKKRCIYYLQEEYQGLLSLYAYLKILRIQNSAMATGAVFLGAWIGGADRPWLHTSLLAFTALLATGFGNVINDIFDIETDRISHPDRPLPQGVISKRAATLYAIFLATAALGTAFFVAPLFGYATLVPLALLTLYALFLKGTPLTGNSIVSLLVAYSLLFGALDAPFIGRLLIPALLAMLLNLSREIIKDLEDEDGDRSAGIATTAKLNHIFLRRLLYAFSTVYLILLFVPVKIGLCAQIYTIIVCLLVLPLHFFRLSLLRKNNWETAAALLSKTIKFEMLAGLFAISIDHVFHS